MNYYIEDYYESKLSKLRPEYRKWVVEVTTGEDYFAGMDLDEAIKQAFDYQQADDYYAEEEWLKQMEEKEKYPGVIFAPKAKISTICEDDDIPF